MTVASNHDASELADLRDPVAGWARRHSDSAVRRNADHAGRKPAFWATVADLGWLSLLVAEEYGGAGRDCPSRRSCSSAACQPVNARQVTIRRASMLARGK